MALLTLVITSAVFAGSIHHSISSEVEYTARQISVDEEIGISAQERNNLVLALLVGRVANAKADEKSISYHQKAVKVITDYQLSDPRRNYHINNYPSVE
jgi:hypothetical protein